MKRFRGIVLGVGKSLPDLIRLALGLVFFFSGMAKALHPYDFLSNVYGYEMLGPIMGYLTASLVPWLELAIGLCLLTGFLKEGAFIWAALLLGFFLIAQAMALRNELRITCGCAILSNSSSDLLGYGTLLRTATLLVFALGGLVLSLWSPRISLQQEQGREGITGEVPAETPLGLPMS